MQERAPPAVSDRTRTAGRVRAAGGNSAPPSGRAPSRLDITPDKSLIRKLGSTGYRTYEAMSELVDNSIDARAGRKVAVRVSMGYA